MTSSVDIMARRRLIFRYWAQELPSKQIHGLIRNAGFDVSLNTIRRDIRKMGEWLPGIITIDDDPEQAAQEILGKMKIGQARLAQLAFAADNSNAMVGAAKGLVDAASAEGEFRFKAGQLQQARIPLDISGEVKMIDVTEEDLLNVVGPAVAELMARRAQGADSLRPEEDPKESMD